MENEKAMDKRAMTAEREMEILEAVVEKYGIAECLRRLDYRAMVLGNRVLEYKLRLRKTADADGSKKVDTSSLRVMAAEMSVWLNVLSLIIGEPVEEEIAYLEGLAKEVRLGGR